MNVRTRITGIIIMTCAAFPYAFAGDVSKDEQRAEKRAQWESMSEEERPEARARRAENGSDDRRARWESMSEEERAAMMERFRSMSEEDRHKMRERRRSQG